MATAFPPTPVASPKMSNTGSLVGSPESFVSTTVTGNLASIPSTPESMTVSPVLTTHDELCSLTTHSDTAISSSSSSSPTIAIATPSSCTTSSHHVFQSSSRHPSVPHEPQTNFNSLPPSVQLQIFELVLHDGGYANLTPDLIDHSDPRFINPNFYTLLYRHRTLRMLLRVNRFIRALYEPKLTDPTVVTSMAQLNALSGYSYPEQDQKRKGRQNPSFHTGDFNLYDSQTNIPCHVKRKRVGNGSGKRARNLVLIIANLPGMLDANVGPPRFPEWYIQDWMRYDLEALGVEKLTVLAPSKATAANVLHSTLPNHDTIKHLHMEVTTGEPFFAPDVRFYNHYTHDPSADHICPRLSLHSERLETLTIRNMHVCRHLFENQEWPKLLSLNVSFHNGNRGLCCSDGAMHQPWFAENEVNMTCESLWRLCQAKPDLAVRFHAWFDVFTRTQGEIDYSWCTTNGPLISRIVPNGNLHWASGEWWKVLTDGTDRFHTPSPSLSMTTRFMNDSEEVEDGSDFEDDVDIENTQEDYHYQDDSDGYFDLENSSLDATGIAISNGAAVPRHSDTEVVTAPLFTLLPKKPRQMKIL